MKKILALLLAAMMAFGLAACGGSGDELEGTWTGTSSDGAEATWTFDGAGKCHMNYIIEQDGTYEISGEGELTLQMEMWDAAKVYSYAILDGNLVMNDTAGLAPSYDLNKQ